MTDYVMKARVAKLKLLDEITDVYRNLDIIDEEIEEIALVNHQIGDSSEESSELTDQCGEIGGRLETIELHVQMINMALRRMDKETLELLKDSI